MQTGFAMVHNDGSAIRDDTDHIAPAWPLGFGKGDWVSQRYRLEAFLGEGGMGCVFGAFDLSLNRQVALKFMKHLSAESGRHLLREARLQALVEHDAIGKVFEIGTHQGRTYLTMQCVPGKPLQFFVEVLPLEAKLALLRDVAEAVHAAHCQGLIHRDLKPGNILVCEEADGQLKPYVMDFGLARRLEEAHSTKTGGMRGTPLFMAPEQVRADPKAIDRRTDVYGLGATLYFLLSGRPPHTASNQAAVWVAILEQEAPSLRRFIPNLPKQVDAIVSRALANDPSKRYGSAKALAEDLGRYLNGEPILARPPDTMELLGRWLRRHRWWVRTALISFVVAVSVLAWGVMERRTLAERARIYNRFVQQTEEVEALHRNFSMLPLHEVAAEREYLLEKMADVESQMAAMGGIAQGPGHYALGRAQLALKRYDEAEVALRKAHDANPEDPAIALALGQVLSALYQRELARVATLAGSDQREKGRAAAIETYRNPSRSLLRISREHGLDLDRQPMVEAQLALFDGDDARALELLEQLFLRQPWFYEARILQGQILTRLGDESRDAGNFDGARNQYGLARSKLEEATRIGRSDGEGYRAIASLCLAEALLAKMNAPLDLDAALAGGLASCEQALKVDGQDGEALWLTSIFKSMTAEAMLQRGDDPTSTWHSALGFAERSLARNPDRPLVYNSMGMVHQVMGHHVWRRGDDPVPHFEKAIEVLQKGLAYHPNLAAIHNNLGLAYLYRAQASATLEADDPGLKAAIAHMQTSIEHLPGRLSSYLNLGAANWMLAEAAFFSGRNPEPALCEAAEAFDHVLERMPDHGIAHYNKGSAVQMQGEFLLAKGQNPDGLFLEALDHFHIAEQALPGVAEVYNAIAVAHLNLAKQALAEQKSPLNHLNEVAIAANRALDIRPGWDLALFNWGLAEGLKVRHFHRSGVWKQALLDLAWSIYEETFRINPQFSDALVAQGDLGLVQATAGFDSAASLERAGQRYQKALQIDGGNAFAHFGLGKLALQKGLNENIPLQRRKVCLQQAVASLGQALAIQAFQDEFVFNLGLVHLALVRLSLEEDNIARPVVGEVRAFCDLLRKRPDVPGWLPWLEAEFNYLEGAGETTGGRRLRIELEEALRLSLRRAPRWRADMLAHSSSKLQRPE